jgi:hypothetical protein
MNKQQISNIVITESNLIFNTIVKELKRGQIAFDFLSEQNTFGFITIKNTNYKVIGKLEIIIGKTPLAFTDTTIFETESQIFIKVFYK